MATRNIAPPAHAPTAAPLWSDLSAAHDRVGKARPWFAEGAIEGEPVVMLMGPEKKGKSWLAMQLAVAVAAGGVAWLDTFTLQRQGAVAYLDAEYGEFEFARRIARITRGYGKEPRDVLPLMRHNYSAELVLARDDPAFGRVLESIGAEKPALIVLDPLRNHLMGSENDSAVVVEANRCIRALKAAGRCPLLALHHLNKAGAYSGSRAIMSTADLIIEGSDEDRPTYETRGRVVRHGDAIAMPFRVDVSHADDDDDTKAATRLLYLPSDAATQKASNEAQVNPEHLARVEAGIKEHGWPTSAKEFARLIGMSPKVLYKVCNYLETIGEMIKRPDKNGQPNGWDYVGHLAAAA